MLGVKRIANHTDSQYATGGDFCRIFKDDMSRLYLLSYLLTADQATAEQCFVGGLENSQNSNPVFKDWAESWARRMIIANAVRIVQPRPDEDGNSEGVDRERAASLARAGASAVPREIANILELRAFDRFAFVLRVLEGYSERECSLMLGCSAKDLSAARTRIFQQMATTIDLRGQPGIVDATQPARGNGAPRFVLEALSHFAAAA